MQGVAEAGPEAILPLNSKVLGGIGKGIERATDWKQSGTEQDDTLPKQPIEINIYDNKEAVRAYVNDNNAIDATIRRF